MFARYGPPGNIGRNISHRMPINPETGRTLSVRSKTAVEETATPTSVSGFSFLEEDDSKPRPSTDTGASSGKAREESTREESGEVNEEEGEEADDGSGGKEPYEVLLSFGGKAEMSPLEVDFGNIGIGGDSDDDGPKKE